MSGFQIPGLGFAKPDEKLPPLTENKPTSQTTAIEAPVKEADSIQTSDSAALAPETNGTAIEQAVPTISSNTVATTTDATDAMVVDQPESPPSLTGALEAALGGLEEMDTSQQEPQAQAQAPAQAGETAEAENENGEHPEWEMDSSPYESSSESSTDSSDEDSDNEGYELLGVEETARLLMEAEGGSDDEGDRAGKASGTTHLRTKNELPEDPIPRPDVTITPEMKVEELGAIEHIVDNIAVVKAIVPGEYQVLDTGSVLCDESRAVIGAVAETIGKVLQPMYTVYFNSAEEIRELGLAVGARVFYPVDHATYVFTEPLKNAKGSDASNLHDEEVGDEEMEFSDDEKEAEYKRALKQKKKDKWKSNNPGASSGGGSGRGDKEPHPLRQEVSADVSLNYDDDGPYKPLTRPPGYGSGPVSEETYDHPPRSNFQRGRRGDSRGRGNRGRGGNRGGRGGGPPRDGYSLPPQGAQHHTSQHQAPQQWNNAAPPAQAAAPTMPNFGFQLPGWPQQPPAQGSQASAPPPPPPGWPGAAQGQGQNGAAPINPALFAALLSHMQSQGPQQQWGGQQQPPPPPPPGYGQ